MNTNPLIGSYEPHLLSRGQRDFFLAMDYERFKHALNLPGEFTLVYRFSVVPDSGEVSWAASVVFNHERLVFIERNMGQDQFVIQADKDYTHVTPTRPECAVLEVRTMIQDWWT